MPVLAVIQQGNAVVSLREIHPLLSAALKTCHIPARVLVRLSGQVAELHVKCRLVRVHRHREVYFEQCLVLFPVHMRLKIDPAAVRVEDDLLMDRRL